MGSQGSQSPAAVAVGNGFSAAGFAAFNCNPISTLRSASDKTVAKTLAGEFDSAVTQLRLQPVHDAGVHLADP